MMIIDSKGIKATYDGQYKTILKLADPPEGHVWIGGILKKDLLSIGVSVVRSLNVNHSWYFLVEEKEIKKVSEY